MSYSDDDGFKKPKDKNWPTHEIVMYETERGADATHGRKPRRWYVFSAWPLPEHYHGTHSVRPSLRVVGLKFKLRDKEGNEEVVEYNPETMRMAFQEMPSQKNRRERPARETPRDRGQHDNPQDDIDF